MNFRGVLKRLPSDPTINATTRIPPRLAGADHGLQHRRVGHRRGREGLVRRRSETAVAKGNPGRSHGVCGGFTGGIQIFQFFWVARNGFRPQ